MKPFTSSNNYLRVKGRYYVRESGKLEKHKVDELAG